MAPQKKDFINKSKPALIKGTSNRPSLKVAKKVRKGIRVVPMAKVTWRKPPSHCDEHHVELETSFYRSIELLESICRFMKNNVDKLCDSRTHPLPPPPPPSSNARRLLDFFNHHKNHLRRSKDQVEKKAVLIKKDRVEKKTIPIKKTPIKLSSLENIPPGFKHSEALVVPFDENRKPSFTTCELPEVSDPEKGSRCFDYYRGELPGSQDDEASEYYVKNGKKLGRRPESEIRKFKKDRIETRNDDEQKETSDVTAMLMD